MIGGGGRKPFQPAQLALSFLTHVLRKIRFGEPVTETTRFARITAAVELFLDGTQLLPQHVIPLLLTHLGLSLAGDLAAQLEDVNLMSEMSVHTAQRFVPGLGV